MIIATIVALFVFTLAIVLVTRGTPGIQEGRQKTVLERIHRDAVANQRQTADISVIRRDFTSDISNPLLQSLVRFGPVTNLYELMLKAGFYGRVKNVVIFAVILFVVATVLIARTKFAAFSPIIAFFAVWFLVRKYMKGRIRRRNESFIANFPDAIDIIVRSVRAGHPLNTALRMIAENSDPPVSTEFKQVVDEVAYGRTLIEALGRLAQRIDEPDLQFFIVVLSVQQETGSNLAEVLTNLSGVIRKRKQLRLKIKAMTSEGRATAYVLGALPVVVFGALMVVSPNYLTPLFNTSQGNVLLASAIGLIVTAFVIVKQMINIDI